MLIGHELVQLTRAKVRLLGTEVRSEARRLAKDLGNLGQPSRLQADLPAMPEARASARERAAEALGEQP